LSGLEDYFKLCKSNGQRRLKNLLSIGSLVSNGQVSCVTCWKGYKLSLYDIQHIYNLLDLGHGLF